MRLPGLLRPIGDEADERRAARMKWYVLAAAAIGAVIGAALAVVDPPAWIWRLMGVLLIVFSVGNGLVLIALVRRLISTGQPWAWQAAWIGAGMIILMVIGGPLLLTGSP